MPSLHCSRVRRCSSIGSQARGPSSPTPPSYLRREVAAAAPEDELIELLDAHPRIGADPAEMSDLSRGEQEDDAPTGDALAQELADLNAAYEQRFGFRYVVFVAGRPRAAILPLMEVALRNERNAELRRGIDDAIYIAGDRLDSTRDAYEEMQESGQ